jgi:hypothetical protein
MITCNGIAVSKVEIGNDLKDDQRQVCNIWKEGIDNYRWDRPRSLGIVMV